MTRLVFPTLGWQLQECNPAICSQGIFYSQLLEPSHRACRNAWMLLPADRGHKESVVWLRSMSCSRAKKKKKSMYWASIPIHASLCVYVCLCVCRSQHTCVCMSAYMLTLVSSVSNFWNALLLFETIEVIVSTSNPEECQNGSLGTEPSYLWLVKFSEKILEFKKEPVLFLLMVKPLSLIRDFSRFANRKRDTPAGTLSKVESLFHFVLSNLDMPGTLTEVVVHATVVIDFQFILSLQEGKSPIISHGLGRGRFGRFLFTLKSETPPHTQVFEVIGLA